MSSEPVGRARTRTMTLIAIGLVAAFLVLLLLGTVPRVSDSHALAAAAESATSAANHGSSHP